MDLDDAMKRAVQKFYEGHDYSNYEKTGKKLKYTKDAFDSLEKDIRKKIKPVEEVKENE